jgi:rSAM/selenodomain-associated transferase 1
MVDLQGQAVVALLTRAPSSAGKTRLFAALGCAPDAGFLAALLLDTLDAARVPGITRAICYTPRHARAELRALVPADVVLVPQRGGDLGERMRHAFDDLLSAGAAGVALIGSDLPTLDPRSITEAHRLLRERPDIVVFGPATDGGYYLVAATRTPRPLFADMTWGGPSVLEETERRAIAMGLPIAHVMMGTDIDTPADLRNLLNSSAAAPRTRAAVAKLSGTPNVLRLNA